MRSPLMILIAILSPLFLAACGSMVSNGTVTDEAVVPLSDAESLRIPKGATIELGGEKSTVRVVMVKTLSFAGHPPRKISITKGARIMGVATRRDGSVLEFATYGEWDSHIEGAAMIESLKFIVPKGATVTTGTDLWGENSKAQGFDRDDAAPWDYPETYWYAPTKPAAGWTPYPGD